MDPDLACGNTWALGQVEALLPELPLKYITAYSSSSLRPMMVLPPGETSDAIADACRAAALSFVQGVTAGWDKSSLAMWLVGDYANATRHLRRPERVAPMDNDEPSVDEGALEDLLTKSRTQLIAELEQAALDGNLACAQNAETRGLVRRASTDDGTPAWLPVDASRMRLRDRLRALLAADYLNRPADYLALYVCHRCENVVFDERAKRLGYCTSHARDSGVVRKSERTERNSLTKRTVEGS